MATIETDVEDDIIKCSICLEVFKTPKYLPCLHTFCEACICSYIKTSLAGNGNRKLTKPVTSFNCPVCRIPVPTPSQFCQPKDWAKSLPLNHLIVTLMDQNKLKKKTKLCDPCQTETKNVTAKSWCTVCSEALCDVCDKTHRKMKMLKDHYITRIDDMQSGMPIFSPVEHCDEHKDKKIEIFCVDHKRPCCLTCMTVHHRKCNNVQTLEEAAKGIRDKPEIKELSKRLEESIDMVNKIVSDREKNIGSLHAQKVQMQERIETLRKELNKRLDDLKNVLNRDVESLSKKYVDQLKEEVNEFNNRKKVLENCKNMLRSCTKHMTDINIFLEMDKLQKRQEEQESYLKGRIENLQCINFELALNADLTRVPTSVETFGNVNVYRTPLRCYLTPTPIASKSFLQQPHALTLNTLRTIPGNHTVGTSVDAPYYQPNIQFPQSTQPKPFLIQEHKPIEPGPRYPNFGVSSDTMGSLVDPVQSSVYPTEFSVYPGQSFKVSDDDSRVHFHQHTEAFPRNLPKWQS